MYRTNRNETKVELPEASDKGKRKIIKRNLRMYIIENNLKNGLELIPQKEAGSLVTLWLYNINKANPSTKLLKDAWKIGNTDQLIRDENVDRIRTLGNFSSKSFVCNGLWLKLVEENLLKNDNDYDEFAHSFHLPIKEGRGKHWNILLYGLADIEKTFLLQPSSMFCSSPGQNP